MSSETQNGKKQSTIYSDKGDHLIRNALNEASLRGAERRSNLNGKPILVYIMTNIKNTVFYTGITNSLARRIYEHKEKLVAGFTKKYNVTKLVYYEVLRDAKTAILREKQIKGGSRAKKIKLIESMNSEWRDLYVDF